MSTPRKYPISGDSGATTGTWTRCWAGKVKGRPLVGHYVNHHLEAVDAASIPCRMQGWIQDTENNHLLKAGLRYVLAASHVLLVPVARKAVVRQAKAALSLLVEVSCIRVSPERPPGGLQPGGPFRYASMLAATTPLLEGS